MAKELWGSLVSFYRFRRGIVRRRMVELMLGLLAGEVLFAEVLVTPTGISKGCGYVFLFAYLFVAF